MTKVWLEFKVLAWFLVGFLENYNKCTFYSIWRHDFFAC